MTSNYSTRKWKLFLLFAGIVIIGYFASINLSPRTPLNFHGKIDRIVIEKSAHRMTLFSNNQPIRSYTVSLGRSSGDKIRQGDHKTPLGIYFVDELVPNSRFHLALHLSYPNAADRAQAKSLGLDPGGNIEIHGLPKFFAWLGPLHHFIDWTDGCIAVTNPEIEEIYPLIPLHTPVEIRP